MIFTNEINKSILKKGLVTDGERKTFTMARGSCYCGTIRLSNTCPVFRGDEVNVFILSQHRSNNRLLSN